MFQRADEGESVLAMVRCRVSQPAILFALFLMAFTASRVHAWTMFSEPFNYIDTYNCTGAGPYTLCTTPSGARPGVVEYHLGDSRYYDNVHTPCPLQNDATYNFVYSPSPWVTSQSDRTSSACAGQSGYWPFIRPNNLSFPSPYPATSGNSVVCFNTSTNNGRASRIAFIGPYTSPPSGPPRAMVRGRLFYSMLLRVADTAAPPVGNNGHGIFHAGFNNDAPRGNNGDLPTATTGTPDITRACARLRLRATALNQYQIGIESDTGDSSTTVWDTNTTYTADNNAPALLIVASYEFKDATTTDDVSSLWIVDPNVPSQVATLGAASAPTYTSTTGTNFPLTSTGGDINQNQIRSFFIREGANTNNPDGDVTRVVFDEVRIGTSWADVTSDVACVAPTVSSISPAYGAKNTTLTGVAITGTNFVQGVTLVKLTMPSQPDIVATAVDVSDSSHLTCTFSIPAGAVAGTRDLVVTTCPDSPATLSGSFHVVCGSAADFNCDSFVDGVDLVSFFEPCAATGSAGSGVPFATGCDAEDMDHDGDVDMNDFAIFQKCYRGSTPADPSCGY